MTMEMEKLTQGLPELMEAYLKDPTEQKKELVVRYIQATQEILTHLGGKQAAQMEQQFEQDVAKIKANLQAELQRSTSILVRNPTLKAFTFIDKLSKVLK